MQHSAVGLAAASSMYVLRTFDCDTFLICGLWPNFAEWWHHRLWSEFVSCHEWQVLTCVFSVVQDFPDVGCDCCGLDCGGLEGCVDGAFGNVNECCGEVGTCCGDLGGSIGEVCCA